MEAMATSGHVLPNVLPQRSSYRYAAGLSCYRPTFFPRMTISKRDHLNISGAAREVGVVAMASKWESDSKDSGQGDKEHRAFGKQEGWRDGQESSSNSVMEDSDDEAVQAVADAALQLDDRIPDSSTELVARVTSKAYAMRHNLHNSLQPATSFDVVDSNPWRDSDPYKPVFALACSEDTLFSLRTRRPRSEVERELNMLLGRDLGGGGRGAASRAGRQHEEANTAVMQDQRKQSGTDASGRRKQPFTMRVDDIREGVLVFEDEEDAYRYCSLLTSTASSPPPSLNSNPSSHTSGGSSSGARASASSSAARSPYGGGCSPSSRLGARCIGVAHFSASELFSVCRQSNALAVVFKKGVTPPQPDRLQRILTARNRSLEED